MPDIIQLFEFEESQVCAIYSLRQKVYHAIFVAIARNFNVKFCPCIACL